jgi:hypothetical protein
MIVKNTYGTSVAFSVREFGVVPKNEFTGSALDRKKQTPLEKEIKKAKPKSEKEPKPRSLSQRSKQKIRKKLICFARCYKKLSFVTLTFLNKVTDKQAIEIHRKFIDNVKKRSENFQYIWVAERQTKNDAFKGNIHFHMITNKYWKIEKWWNYWLDLQKKNGIIPRDKDFKPSSAFDVRELNSNNIRSIASYVTKYVTKNNDKFNCQVWNCSRQVSELYTDFYTGTEFVDEFKKLDAVLKEIEIKDFIDRPILNIKMINLNRQTLKLYKRLDVKNQATEQ